MTVNETAAKPIYEETAVGKWKLTTQGYTVKSRRVRNPKASSPAGAGSAAPR